jgi:hypothetical protein
MQPQDPQASYRQAANHASSVPPTARPRLAAIVEQTLLELETIRSSILPLGEPGANLTACESVS